MSGGLPAERARGSAGMGIAVGDGAWGSAFRDVCARMREICHSRSTDEVPSLIVDRYRPPPCNAQTVPGVFLAPPPPASTHPARRSALHRRLRLVSVDCILRYAVTECSNIRCARKECAS
ncbi:hypothetical protein JB92DRAFT_2970864 [Gautieria morchelliformis]|nr:hypothetical protein JB92DRAFT_2970864 [Gautieria morchelliformis]